jgi:inner membrane protein
MVGCTNMDNLTHTLVGLIAGEAVARTASGAPDGLPASTRRTALLCMGMIGGNLPDLDLLWSMQTFTGNRIGYLLEHRGYTHTLLGCGALAALLYLATLLWLHHRAHRTSARDRWLLGAMAVISVALHLGMDAMNSYGVHPFWPWNNRWYYGDSIFIIEPLYWLATAPLLFVLRSTSARVLLAVALVAGAFAMLFVHGLDPMACGAVVLAVALVWLGRRTLPRTASQVSAVLVAAVFLMFVWAGRVAAHRTDAVARSKFPDYRTLDKVLSPTPGDPLCWDVLLLQIRDDEYVVRHAYLSIASPPAVRSCGAVLSGKGTAPLTAVPAADSHEVRWLGEFGMSRSRLVALIAHDCAARELMQFVRAPFAVELRRVWVLGDLRFDREAGTGMAEIQIAPEAPSACGYHVPWTPPRADLLASPD